MPPVHAVMNKGEPGMAQGIRSRMRPVTTPHGVAAYLEQGLVSQVCRLLQDEYQPISEFLALLGGAVMPARPRDPCMSFFGGPELRQALQHPGKAGVQLRRLQHKNAAHTSL